MLHEPPFVPFSKYGTRVTTFESRLLSVLLPTTENLLYSRSCPFSFHVTVDDLWGPLDLDSRPLSKDPFTVELTLDFLVLNRSTRHIPNSVSPPLTILYL